jgi:hypothetical protein
MEGDLVVKDTVFDIDIWEGQRHTAVEVTFPPRLKEGGRWIGGYGDDLDERSHAQASWTHTVNRLALETKNKHGSKRKDYILDNFDFYKPTDSTGTYLGRSIRWIISTKPPI